MIQYTVTGKNKPEIHDSGTVYEDKKCSQCGNVINPIKVLGAYFPAWKKEFGLAYSIGGIIASEAACNYLIENQINAFIKKKVNIRYENYKCTNKYYWIDPINTLELEETKNTKIISVCNKCGYRTIKQDELFMPKFRQKEFNHFAKLENTLFTIVDDYFVSLMRNIPEKSLLDFNVWFTENTHPELMET